MLFDDYAPIPTPRKGERLLPPREDAGKVYWFQALAYRDVRVNAALHISLSQPIKREVHVVGHWMSVERRQRKFLTCAVEGRQLG